MPRIATAQKITNRIAREANDRGVGPTPERLRMAGENVEAFNADIDGHKHYTTLRMTDNSRLDGLLRTDEISNDQYNAGDTFFRDWYLAGMAASGVIDMAKDRVDCSVGEFMTDRKLDALGRLDKVMKRMDRISLRPVLEIVVFGMPFWAYGRRYCKQRNRSRAMDEGKKALIKALSGLAHIYYGKRKSGVRSAHTEDYRPNEVALGER
jgi:hypothetical protein